DPQSRQTFNTLYLRNKLYGSTHGLELSVDWKPIEPLKFQLGYTYIGFDLEVDSDSINLNLGNIVEETRPKHQVSLQSTYTITRDLQLNLWGRYVGQLKSSKDILSRGEMNADSYLEMDANLSWKVMNNMELMLVGQNLLNGGHLEYVSEFSTPPIEVQRSFYGKITYHF
ncbi:MAG TPA: TonB-dependent receptor, partial [Desulfobulbus sp.]|nr:TonB-dependent receptor [Desulfobulbus sp.]